MRTTKKMLKLLDKLKFFGLRKLYYQSISFTRKTKLFINDCFYPTLSPRFLSNRITQFFEGDKAHNLPSSKIFLGYGMIHYSIIRNTRPKRILCIGSRKGFIPAICALACKDNQKGFVDFIDAGYGQQDLNHWTGIGYWKTKSGKKCFKTFGLNKWIKLYLMTSKQFAKKYQYRYDYIYIDGDHSYKGVKTDYQSFWPRLNKNGFISFHDINTTKPQPEGVYGVYKLWRQIAKQNSFTFSHGEASLGIIQKNIKPKKI